MKGSKLLLKLVLLLVLLAGLAYLVLAWSRPARRDYQAPLFQGVSYTRQARSAPRLLMVHLVEIDLRTPGIDFLVTPGQPESGLDLFARTTSDFLNEFGLQVAINGSFFEPFHANTPWDYYPHRGDPVDVTGLAISNGRRYSHGFDLRPVLCLSPGQAQIRVRCPEGTQQALAGGPFLILDGELDIWPNRYYLDEPNPRTAVGVDKAGATLWLIVVDGRQSGYSEGVTLLELAELLLPLGVDRAMNLDGGGSTTLVMAGPSGAKTLNAPFHTRIPMRQRPVANHLGVYARPLLR